MLSSTFPHSPAPVSAFEVDQLSLPAPFTSEMQAASLPSHHARVSATGIESIETGSMTGTGSVTEVELVTALDPDESGFEADTRGTATENGLNIDTTPVATTITTTAVPEPLQDDESTIFAVTTSDEAKIVHPSPTTQQTGDPESWPEQPRQFLERIKETLSKAELANLLSKSCDPFHLAVLRVHMESFDFKRDPIDLALRYGILSSSCGDVIVVCCCFSTFFFFFCQTA